MKKHKALLLVFAISVLSLLMVLTVYAYEQQEVAALADTTFTSVGNLVAEAIVLEPEEYDKITQNYVERYGLKEVDKPQKRNHAQVLQKLAELSEKYELVRQVYEEVELYSDIILEHLANNPEMAAFVLGSPECYGRVYGGYTDYELESEYPLLLQYDPRWGYFEYGGKELGLSGCGPTCLAMAILALTDYEDVTPDKIAAYSLEKKYYVPGVGTAWDLLDEVPKLYGLKVEHPSMKEESIKAELDEGKILICSMRRGEFTADGHFIVIYGYDENGFRINDPKCVARSNRIWKYSEFQNQLKRIWAVEG